ncbi:unnamed protein product [Psylliodes chrysocephalus]|uniref:Uncharacterized protein n=1 Tax=Psylliodes chrysocephalus TaxID=3402493 RepID=A0A9P0CJA2_9CUCU|nr:unnamed protein product [Psylliodes chrysocephala]
MYLSEILEKFHNFFIFHMFEWCSSYIYMIITLWICLGVITYLITIVAIRVYFHYRNENQIVNNLCKIVEENDIVNCVRMVELYPKYINAFSDGGYTPFLVACANGNTQMVKVMLKRGADITLKSKKHESPFYLATFYYIKFPQFKNATCIRELYYAGANVDEPNDKDLTPLQMAAMFGHTALVRWLLLKNASIKVTPDPYLIAMSQGHQDTAGVIWKMTRGFPLDFK